MTKPPEDLLTKLRRANLQVALSTLAVVSITLIILSFLALRIYVNQHVSLVARTIADSVQAAVVFKDKVSAQESMNLIAQREDLAEVVLHGSDGTLLAYFQSAEQSGLTQLLSSFGVFVLPHKASVDILHDGVKVGQISAQVGFAVYLWFLLRAILAVVCSLGLVLLLCRWLSRKFEHDIVKPLDQLASLTRAARISRKLDIRAPTANVLEINALGKDFNALMGEIVGYEQELLSRQDKLEEANVALSHQALHDGLTGLPNRVWFHTRLAKAVQAGEQRKDMLAVMYIDCDHFKQINDTLGHAAGDEVLVEFAQRMKAQLREGDAVARLGGDEFAVMLNRVKSLDDVQSVAAKMVSALAIPIWTKSVGQVSTSATIGVALFPTHGNTLDALLGCADAVMYRAKRQQRGTYIVAQDCDVQASLAICDS